MIEDRALADLTERQAAVAQAIVLRRPIKQIAADLGIAPSTVTDHINALKRKCKVDTTTELVESLLKSRPAIGAATPERYPPFEGALKNRVADSAWSKQEKDQDDGLVLSDSIPANFSGDWNWTKEPVVVPEELDGPKALLPRIYAIAKSLAMILAAVVLAVTALQGMEGVVESFGSTSRTN